MTKLTLHTLILLVLVLGGLNATASRPAPVRAQQATPRLAPIIALPTLIQRGPSASTPAPARAGPARADRPRLDDDGLWTPQLARPRQAAGDVIIAGLQTIDNLLTQYPAEFVELFNTTNQTISLESLELLSRVDDNNDGVVEVAWQLSTDLTGKAIAPHGFFLIAESGVAAPGGVHDVEADMDLNTNAGGAGERAVSLQVVIDGQPMDYVLYGRHDGTDLPLDVPPGDLPFDGTTWPRSEVIRNTTGDGYFAEGLLRREAAGELYAGYAVEGFYTDEDSLGDGCPNGVWSSQHVTLYNCYQARNSLSPPVLPPPDQPVLVSPGDGQVGVPPDPELRVNVRHPALDEMDVTFYGREAGAEAGDDFTIIVLPDTQYYAETYTRTFISQTQWIVDHQEALNVVYVAHVGDLVETANLSSEWEVASAAMGRLENPLTTGLPDGLPYGPAVGNHDQFPADDPEGTALYNVYFGASRFAGRGYYGGHYGSDNDNHYALFGASGMDFIVMDLEYNPSPDPAVLAWAENLLQTYSQRRAILVSHYLLMPNACFSPQGQVMFDALADNPNLFLMLCGHVSYEAKRRDAPGANALYTLLADYQERVNGGNGWLRILEFSPAHGEIRVKTYSPLLDQYESDGDSQFTLGYDMSGPFTELGMVSGVGSGDEAALDWPGRPQDTAYEWYVVVSDGDARTRGPTWTFTTGTAPVAVRISGPTTAGVGQSTTFTASVSPLTTTPPLTYTWQASGQADVVTSTGTLSHSISYTWGTIGRQTLTVTARNALDAVSATHHVTISIAPPVPPESVRISGPTTGGLGQSYRFTAVVTPPTTTTPLTYTWQASGQADVLTSTEALSHSVSYTWGTIGRQTLTVTARNALDAVSATHHVTISTTVPPNRVRISGPTTGTPGQSATFTATVSPGTTTPPITFTWQASGQADVLTRTAALSHSVSYTWGTIGRQTLTVTARNALDAVSATHRVTISTTVPPGSVRISGPTTGRVSQSTTFTATVSPLTTTTPVTFTWQASGQADVVTRTGALSHSVSYTWDSIGKQIITVTARNALDAVSATHSVYVSTTVPPESVSISGPTTGTPGQGYAFTASVSPLTTTTPITFTWQASGQSKVLTSTGVLSHSVSYAWDTVGRQAITVTARNTLNAVSATHSIDVIPFYVYLPLAVRNESAH